MDRQRQDTEPFGSGSATTGGSVVRGRRADPRATLVRIAALFVVWSFCAGSSWAQGPQFDVGAPPGAAGGASTVGQPLGAANFPEFDTPSITPFSGRPGPQGSHVPVSGLSTPGAPMFRTQGAQQTITQNTTPVQLPQYGELDLPADFVMFGPENGMTIDAAIELLVQQNLDLQAARLEIPMAQADVLTASLRANPIFYADTQLVPYGHFSFLRPGGPAQTDINLNLPLDVTFKRLARIDSANAAKYVTEAQLQDAVRNQIDNLYGVYEDVVAAGLTVQFSELYLEGIRKVSRLTEDLFKGGQVQQSDLFTLKATVMKSELQLQEAVIARTKANRALALILNLPLDRVEEMRVRDSVGLLQTAPLPRDRLVAKGLEKRPDLLAARIALRRANADLKLAKANAYPDVYLLYQPYTLQNNTYLGVPSAYSWTLGVTATVPLFNRNQGNVLRAKINIPQTEIQMASQERGVVSDVLIAEQELDQSREAVRRLRGEIVPTSKLARDAAFNRFKGGQTSALEYLAAQQDYNDVVRSYRDAMVRHRRAVLDLNTALGERVLP